ncbi:MAG TPA: hypothetical protein VG603_06830 [Chitinophagales bacterium]|nr:hypothetical protein [Chitinophagales bacterium]
MTEMFDFNAKVKKPLFWMMGAGVIGLLLLFLYPNNHFARLWSNLLANTYYFTGIGLFGLFAVAAGQIAYGSWQTLEKRIFLSLSGFARFGGFILLLIVGLGLANVHNLYTGVVNILHSPVTPNHTTKVIYFAPVFWLGRIFVYAILWFAFSVGMNNFFGRTDQTDPKVYKRSKLLCGAFIVVFALTESAISWDVIMSLDPGWYSTLFGWYNFASYGCAAWAMTILLVLFLKSQGYLKQINENHIHDLGKLLFGFSIFWTYLWFDQFMLQWYANLPDETTFWVKRFDIGYFKITVFLTLIVNFLFPLLFLIKRSAKRNFKMIGFGAALLILGHYVDFFNYTFVEPNWNNEVQAKRTEEVEKANTVQLYADAEGRNVITGELPFGKEKEEGAVKAESKKEGEAEEAPAELNYASIGIPELLVFVGFLGIFLYLFFTNLAKRPIVPENDPYLKENELLEVTYA